MAKEIILGEIRPRDDVYWITSYLYKQNPFFDYISSSEAYGYKIHDPIFNIIIYISKGHEEYKILDELMTNHIINQCGQYDESVEKYADLLCIKHLSTEELYNAINDIKKIAYDIGYKAAQDDMKKVLGI